MILGPQPEQLINYWLITGSMKFANGDFCLEIGDPVRITTTDFVHIWQTEKVNSMIEQYKADELELHTPTDTSIM